MGDYANMPISMRTDERVITKKRTILAGNLTRQASDGIMVFVGLHHPLALYKPTQRQSKPRLQRY
jgi:hypothetical protein